MKKFMVIGYTTEEGFEQMKTLHKDQQKEIMGQWYEWKDKIGEHLIDMVTPMIDGTKLLEKGLIESSDKEVSGYMMIQADNMAEAIALIEDSPIYRYRAENSFEIHEYLEI